LLYHKTIMKIEKPYSESCEQNKEPILAVLCDVLINTTQVLEIGSGTGQHAVHFGKNLPHLNWQTSDVIESHNGIAAWINEANLPNIYPPINLNVSSNIWHTLGNFDGVFSANTVHIMHWNNVVDMFSGIGKILLPGSKFCLYGPFNYDGDYTSPSNAQFDQWLKNRDSKSGIKDFEALIELALAADLKLVNDFAMPANNRILVWNKLN